MSSLKTTDPIALKALFSEDLYYVDEPVSPTVITESKNEISEPDFYNYLGENNKYFLILVACETAEVILPKDLEVLTNILLAKKMEIRDVAILNLYKYPAATFAGLKSYFVNNKLVLFGINPKSLAIPDIVSNKISTFEGVKILATYSFDEMQNDVAKKKTFWNEMKQL